MSSSSVEDTQRRADKIMTEVETLTKLQRCLQDKVNRNGNAELKVEVRKRLEAAMKVLQELAEKL